MGRPENNGKRKGLSLQRFARAKKYDPSIAREKQRLENIRKSKIARQFKKTLRDEGYTDEVNKVDKIGPSEHKRSLDTFEKSKQKAEDAKQTQKEKEESIAKAAKLRKQKQNERRKLKNKLTKKTSKGQPVLSHQIDHLLGKIQREMK
mmetsp:Transcript_11247/g.19826  ORF Transcript_11247/g.19826 Transcript_11247/m.19826 type:complete len:148 (-) Transcript_11247:831-1274(-)